MVGFLRHATIPMGDSNRTVTATETRMLCISSSPCEANLRVRQTGRSIHATRGGSAYNEGVTRLSVCLAVLCGRGSFRGQRLAGEVVKREGEQGEHQDGDPVVV